MTQLSDFMKYDFIERVLDKADAMTFDNTIRGFKSAIDYLDDVLGDLENLAPHEVYINGDTLSVNAATTYALEALSNALQAYAAEAIEQISTHKQALESELEHRNYFI